VTAVLVTGVSSGIGFAIAEGFTGRGQLVFGTVRSLADGARLRERLGENFVPLVADVTEPATLAAAAKYITTHHPGVALVGLVNNAGIAISGALLEQPIETFENHLKVNLVGPLNVVRAFASLLRPVPGRSSAPRRIVNISSAAGRFAAPFLGAYSASKHGLEGLSGSLRRELLCMEIDVIVVAPGAVRTPIWDKSEAHSAQASPLITEWPWAKARVAFEAMMLKRGRAGIEPAIVAETVIMALTSPNPKPRYAIGRSTNLVAALSSFLPTRLQDRLLARSLGLKPVQSGL
jgi:NAD(P)-dependent dehydrogenase (short-subunit alcohol dehydrogenase family)